MIDELFREALNPYRTARPRRGRIWRGITARIGCPRGAHWGLSSLSAWLCRHSGLDPHPSLSQLVRVASPHVYTPPPMVGLALSQILNLRVAS